MAIEHKKLFRMSSRAPRRVSVSHLVGMLTETLRGALDDTFGSDFKNPFDYWATVRFSERTRSRTTSLMWEAERP